MAGQTPQYGLPYPESVDNVDVPYFQRALADKVEETLTERFQHGEIAFTGTANANSDITITFDPPFATPPTVVASPAGDSSQTGQGWAYCDVEDPTTTSAVIAFHSVDGDIGAFPYRIEWFATDL